MSDAMREKIAFTLWRNDAVRAAPNIVKYRTSEAFKGELGETRAIWLHHADAIIAALPGMVPPLPMPERRNGYWGGKFGYQVAHNGDGMYRVRLNGKVLCRNIKGFDRAEAWANAHHVAQIMQALGIAQEGE